jgi:hypothetical protein
VIPSEARNLLRFAGNRHGKHFIDPVGAAHGHSSPPETPDKQCIAPPDRLLPDGRVNRRGTACCAPTPGLARTACTEHRREPILSRGFRSPGPPLSRLRRDLRHVERGAFLLTSRWE